MKFDAEITTETVEGICTVDYAFFKNAKVIKTQSGNLHVFEDDTKKVVEVFIDLDADNKPVAMGFIHKEGVKNVPYATKTVQQLYDYASTWVLLRQQARAAVEAEKMARGVIG